MPLSDAAVLLGEPLTTLRYRAGGQWIKLGLAELRPPRSGKGKPTWWIHRSVSPKLDRCPDRATREDQQRESLLARFPHHQVELAYKKSYWLRRWRKRCSYPRAGNQTELTIAADVVAEAVRLEGDGFRISVRSLQLWHKLYNELGPHGGIRGVEALVARYADGTPSRSDEAVDFFYSVFHSQGDQSIQTCHDATLNWARKNGYSWPVSYGATARWLREHDNLAETCLHRDGRTEYSHRYMQHLEIDYSPLQPGSRYVLDHCQADFWCRYKDRLIRPWISAAIDARSRCIVGSHWGPVPHQDAIVACMRDAFRDWAVPDKVHIDQGKDFTSELITGFTKAEHRRYRRELGPDWRESLRHQMVVFWGGILGELGIDIAEAIARHPWAKALVERVFRTIHDQFDKTFVTYTGRSSETKPECTEQLKSGPDVPTLEEVRERFTDYLELYHRTVHGGLDGLSPIAVWQTATRLRRAVESELLALMQARGVYRVGANGVRFRVAGTTLGYGATSTALRTYAGRDVFITLDPKATGCCYAYTVGRGSRKFIDRLECNVRIPVDTPVDQLREAIRNLRRRNKHFDRAQREAPQRMNTAAREVRELRRAQLAQLRATGTDDVRSEPRPSRSGPNIVPVRTGFEAVSTPVPAASAPRSDRKSRDLAATAAALSYGHGLTESPQRDRPRATLDLLGLAPALSNDSPEEEGTEPGRDAEGPRPDILGLVAGDRHGQRKSRT